MNKIKAFVVFLALAFGAIAAQTTHAQTLQVLTAGSSAQFGPFAVAAYALAQEGGAKAYHYTVKAGYGCYLYNSPGCYAYLHDNRRYDTDSPKNYRAPDEAGDLWVIWSTNGIWAYLSIDSTVGVRGFQSYPRASVNLTSLSNLPLVTAPTTSNFLFWEDNSQDTALTPTVYNAINGTPLTAANTDIRPEDALFATTRAISLSYGAFNSNYVAYPPVIGYFDNKMVTPDLFSLSTGVPDPVSDQTVPASHAFVTLPVGAAPLIFLANSINLSAATNLRVTQGGISNASALFSGSGNCAGNLLDGVASSVSLSPILLEPISGVMNTAEYTDFQLSNGGSSQETGITTNPAHQACGIGFRDRAIGALEAVKAVKQATVPNVAINPVGYAFFSYEETNSNPPLYGTAPNYKYIMLDGVDPINATYTTGTLPTCDTFGYLNCPLRGGTSFPHLRDGTYRSWSIYRMISDSAPNGNTTDEATAQTLVTEAQQIAVYQVPDFVPFNPVCSVTRTGSNEPGLTVYRQHFTPAGVTLPFPGPNDGPVQTRVVCTVVRAFLPSRTLGGQNASGTESGGDVGGVIEGPFTGNPPFPGPTGARQ